MMDLRMLWFANCCFEGSVSSLMVLDVPEKQVGGKVRSIVCLQDEGTVAFDFFFNAMMVIHDFQLVSCSAVEMRRISTAEHR
jgi:hypothetical protein